MEIRHTGEGIVGCSDEWHGSFVVGGWICYWAGVSV